MPEISRTSWLALPIGGWGALAYSGILALVLAYLFWYRGVRVLGPTRSAMYGNLQPVIALIVAWLALGETPTVVQIVGAAAILFGLVLTRR
jgi:drug/metabolite transporter (DMT)-like permease